MSTDGEQSHTRHRKRQNYRQGEKHQQKIYTRKFKNSTKTEHKYEHKRGQRQNKLSLLHDVNTGQTCIVWRKHMCTLYLHLC